MSENIYENEFDIDGSCSSERSKSYTLYFLHRTTQRNERKRESNVFYLWQSENNSEVQRDNAERVLAHYRCRRHSRHCCRRR